MKLLYIGTFIPDGLNTDYLKYCSIAGEKFQNNLLRHFPGEVEADILTYIEYPIFPKGKDVFIPRKIDCKEEKNITFIKYINLPFLKNITINISVMLYLLKNMKKYDTILAYNLFPPYLIPVVKIKKLFKGKVGSIIADLYIDNYSYENMIKRYMKKRRHEKEIKLIKKLDFCIPITEYIPKDLGFNGPFLKMEGGVNEVESNKISYNNNEIKKVIYTGSLDSVNGIELLIEAAEQLKSEKVEIVIAGYGPLENYIKEKSEKNKKIRFLGKIDNKECLKLQQSADILILTRPKKQLITRYTFPSKLFEYMLSGKPVLITDLDGIDQQYYDYVSKIEVEDSEIIAKQISDLLENYDEALVKAKEGKKFILNYKSWTMQSQEIYNFINSLQK